MYGYGPAQVGNLVNERRDCDDNTREIETGR